MLNFLIVIGIWVGSGALGLLLLWFCGSVLNHEGSKDFVYMFWEEPLVIPFVLFSPIILISALAVPFFVGYKRNIHIKRLISGIFVMLLLAAAVVVIILGNILVRYLWTTVSLYWILGPIAGGIWLYGIGWVWTYGADESVNLKTNAQ